MSRKSKQTANKIESKYNYPEPLHKRVPTKEEKWRLIPEFMQVYQHEYT